MNWNMYLLEEYKHLKLLKEGINPDIEESNCLEILAQTKGTGRTMIYFVNPINTDEFEFHNRVSIACPEIEGDLFTDCCEHDERVMFLNAYADLIN